MISADYLQKLAKSQKLKDLEWSKCYNDPYYWMTNWVRTLDSHDPESPEKPFPEKEYLKILVDKWLSTKILLVPKSRQMMVSWVFAALYLWDTQFHFGRLNFFQSKKADDANDLVKRAKQMYDNQPKFLKRFYKNREFSDLIVNPQNQGNHVYNLLSFPDIKSEIRGVPEGGDVVRMHTLSGILADEAAFQPEMESSYTALKPTLSSGGRFTCVSTAEDNTWFEDAVFDQLIM